MTDVRAGGHAAAVGVENELGAAAHEQLAATELRLATPALGALA